jgi:NAD-dependent SIR2 family protein deacetylase
VPRHRVDAAVTSLNEADAMLVVGSSLMVFSGYRFARSAARAGKPIAAVKLGRTRADEMLSLKVEADCAAVLNAVG